MSTKVHVEKSPAHMVPQTRTNPQSDDCGDLDTRMVDLLPNTPIAALDRAYFNELPLAPFTVLLDGNNPALTALEL